MATGLNEMKRKIVLDQGSWSATVMGESPNCGVLANIQAQHPSGAKNVGIVPYTIGLLEFCHTQNIIQKDVDPFIERVLVCS